MTPTELGAEVFASIESLRAAGFEGFSTVADLAGSRCAEVPVALGVYLVVREPAPAPKFMPSSAAGTFRGQKPHVKPEVLAEKWVPDAIVLYVGQAGGTGVRGQLQQRIKRLIRFGSGKSVAHWGGRYVWQLADHRRLRLAWLPSEEPAALEARLLAAFESRYGALPFANLREEPATGDEAGDAE
jgi:hypothetical protein